MNLRNWFRRTPNECLICHRRFALGENRAEVSVWPTKLKGALCHSCDKTSRPFYEKLPRNPDIVFLLVREVADFRTILNALPQVKDDGGISLAKVTDVFGEQSDVYSVKCREYHISEMASVLYSFWSSPKHIPEKTTCSWESELKEPCLHLSRLWRFRDGSGGRNVARVVRIGEDIFKACGVRHGHSVDSVIFGRADKSRESPA